MPLPVPDQHEQREEVRREVEIDATPEDVWEALITEDGREAWLEPDPDREIHVEDTDDPDRLVWWWWSGDEAPRRVEIQVIATPKGTRVLVIESAPEFPLAQLTASLSHSWTHSRHAILA